LTRQIGFVLFWRMLARSRFQLIKPASFAIHAFVAYAR